MSKKNEMVGVTAVKDFLKRDKAKEVVKTIYCGNKTLDVKIKTFVSFAEICSIALDACDRAEEAKISSNDGSPLSEVCIDNFMYWYTVIANFTNIKIDGLDVNTVWELIKYSDIVDTIDENVDSNVLSDLSLVVHNTLQRRREDDTWKDIGKKLSNLLDKVGESVDETLVPEINEVIQKIGRVANLHDEKLVEAVLSNGTNRTRHNANAKGVQSNS